MFKSVLFVFATLFVLGACSDVALQSAQPAYPQFSLIGAPDRPVTFDLSVRGPGMDTIGLVEVGPDQRSTVLEVPAGRNREFSFVAQDDVFSGHAVASIAGGRETTVTVPIVPGPVFVSLLQDGDSLPRLVQIRDMNARVDSDTVRDRSIGSAETVNVVYSEAGDLWFFEREGEITSGITRISSFPVDGPSDPLIDYSVDDVDGFLSPSALAINSDNSQVAVAPAPFGGLSPPLDVFLETWTESEEIAEDSGLGVSLPSDEDISYISGLSFGPNGTLYALSSLSGGELEIASVALIRIPINDPSNADHTILPGAPTIYQPPNTPWGDVRVVGDSVYAISAAGRAGDPAVYEYDLDLNPVDTWGEITTDPDPQPGEFWGPRRFAATRNPEQLIVIDQKDAGEFDNLDGTGRLVEFQFGTTNGWQEFGREEFGFFDTRLFVGEV